MCRLLSIKDVYKRQITTGQLTKATYIEIAGIIQRYMDRNLKAPNYSTKTGLGAYWGYENMIYTLSLIHISLAQIKGIL